MEEPTLGCSIEIVFPWSEQRLSSVESGVSELTKFLISKAVLQEGWNTESVASSAGRGSTKRLAEEDADGGTKKQVKTDIKGKGRAKDDDIEGDEEIGVDDLDDYF